MLAVADLSQALGFEPSQAGSLIHNTGYNNLTTLVNLYVDLVVFTRIAGTS